MTKYQEKLLSSIKDMVYIFEGSTTNVTIECELGYYHEDKFQSGVSFQYFHALYDALSNSNIWSESKSKYHYAQYKFEDDIIGIFDVVTNPKYEKKQVLREILVKSHNRDYGFKLSLIEIIDKKHSGTIQPKEVILNEQWIYVYEKNWFYKLTKRSSGKNKENACNTEPKFCITLDLKKNKEKKNTITEITLIEKIVDLLGRYDHNHNQLSCNLSLL